jgi:hypothetical protein
MLDDVQTVRPALERFYQSLSNEQKARFNAIAPAGDPDAAGKDQRDFAMTNADPDGSGRFPLSHGHFIASWFLVMYD